MFLCTLISYKVIFTYKLYQIILNNHILNIFLEKYSYYEAQILILKTNLNLIS